MKMEFTRIVSKEKNWPSEKWMNEIWDESNRGKVEKDMFTMRKLWLDVVDTKIKHEDVVRSERKYRQGSESNRKVECEK